MPRKAQISVFALAAVLAANSVRSAEDNFERHPLAARHKSEVGTHFTALSPDETGIKFVNRYDDPRMWAERYEPFAFGSTGTGIAIGDFDDDGKVDLYVAGKTSHGRLYRNLGNWRFEDVTAVAGLATASADWEGGASFADVDNDGDLDLYVCRWAAHNLLYINEGNGRFSESAKKAGLDLADASVMAAFADYDRDGQLDVFVQTNLLNIKDGPRGQRDRLYRNRGNGTFEETTDKAGIFGETQGHAAIWWDPDENGWPDLYVGNDFAAPDQLYLNRQDGAFVNVLDTVVPYSSYFSMGIDVGDVNNDGSLDLFVADMLPTSRKPYVAGMLNMQAKTAIDIPPNAAPQYMRNVLYLNTGTARFQEAAILAGVAASGWTWSARFEDLDEDGRIDLHITNGMFRNFMDADFLARVNRVEVSERAKIVRAAPELKEKSLCFRNLGDLRFEEVGHSWGLDHEGISFGAGFGDFDADGDLDLIVANYNAPPSVYRNDSFNTHRVLIGLRGKTSNHFGLGAKIRIETRNGIQVRTITNARGYLSSSEPIAHFGLGPESKIDRLTIYWPSGCIQVLNNLEADFRYTVTEAESQEQDPLPSSAPQFQDITQQTGLAVGFAEQAVQEFATQPLLPARQHTVGPGLAVGDLNGDGMDEVLIGGGTNHPRKAMVQVGAEHVALDSAVVAELNQAPDAALLIFEANGDGIPDLFISKGGITRPALDTAYKPRLLLGAKETHFVEAAGATFPDLRESLGPVVAADFDRDGRLDLFLGGRVVPGEYGATPSSALWRNSGTGFNDVTASLAPDLNKIGHVQAALWTDVNQDGWIDLLVATHWGPIKCWLNQEGRKFAEASQELGFASAGNGWWNSIAAADFNHDGTVDYAVGNLGLNTRYRATETEPVVLYSGAFDSSGRIHLIETETTDKRLHPIRSRDSLLAAIPSLRSRVGSYMAFAEATIETIVSSDRLESSRTFSVTQMMSGIFLSTKTSEGQRFVFKPLPRLAQIAPIYGLVAEDFNGDGQADLCAVQNSHAAHAEIGRFSGGIGQFMRGTGDGNFVPINARDSGLVVPGEARGLAVKDFDLDGWPDLVVSQQNGPVLSFLNQPGNTHRSVSIHLKGDEHNPKAIGARVTMIRASGKSLTREVYSGGGYLSQSTATLFFGHEESDPPRQVLVAWPNGTSSVHHYPAGATGLRLTLPPPPTR